MSGTVVLMHSLKHVHHVVPKEDVMRPCCLGGLMTSSLKCKRSSRPKMSVDNEELPAVTL